MTSHRRFRMNRSTDVTGTSGTGTVAEGVEFTDGTVVIRWRPIPATSTCVYGSIYDLLKIHGHDGATVVDWLDDAEIENDTPVDDTPALGDEQTRSCDICGNVRLCAWTPDPFVAEIHPEDDGDSVAWWCDPCYGDRAMEI
jgi:hypothetical protein